MTPRERFELYEKLYFHEIDRRDKLHARLNLPLVMLIGLLSFFGFLLSKAPTSSSYWLSICFWSLYDCAFALLMIAAWHFKQAWARGNYDYVLPVVSKIDEYRATLDKHYEGDEEQSRAEFERVILNYYIRGATTNAENNDTRNSELHSCSGYVIASFVLSLLSFIPLYLASPN